MTKEFRFPVRIYYEDTDTGGIVYYANYLKFAERARTEALRELGFSQFSLMKQQGLSFVVRACELNCLAPAYLDDVLQIRTCFKKTGHAKLDLSQAMLREDQVIATLDVVIACINSKGKPAKLPGDLRRLLIDFGENNNG